MIDRAHLIQFVLLFVIYAIGIYIFINTADFSLKKLTAVWLALLYPAWGILHHLEHRNLNRTIVAEYGLIGVITLVVLLTVIR